MAQIGTIELQTQNSGVVQLPVFDTADAGSSVYDMVRVQTATGTGFVPFVDPVDASFPYFRIQTQNNGILAGHDTASLGATMTTTSTVSGGTTTLTVYEDTDGDMMPENQHTVTLAGGSESFSLTSLNADLTGSNVWFYLDSTNSVTQYAELQDVTISY